MPIAEHSARTAIRSYERHADERAEMLTCTPVDPFGIDDRCASATGHYPIASCGAVVCVHCSKVFWQ